MSHPSVAKYRKELEEAGQLEKFTSCRLGKDGRTYDTSNIGGAGAESVFSDSLRSLQNRKSRKDKAALLHPKGAGLSDRQIAEYVGVDHKSVGKYRAELAATGEVPQIATRTVKRGDQEYQIDTSNIGGAGAESVFQPRAFQMSEPIIPTHNRCILCNQAEGKGNKGER